MPQPAKQPIPEGMHSVTAHLWFNGDCADAIELYQKAFGARLDSPAVPGPDGKGIMHALLTVGDSKIMLADAWPGAWEHGPRDGATMGLFLYTEDCDAAFQQAVEAGCEVMSEPTDMFWGDRMAKVKDPFGHCWGIATHKWVYSPQEMKEGEKQWVESLDGDEA